MLRAGLLRVTASPEGFTLVRRVVAEALGTMLLLATVVGSGVMGESLASGNVAIALLANAIATGAMLVPLILVFGPVSGGHFNPVVSLVAAIQRTLSWRDVPAYLAAQVSGAVAGVFVAHAMFALPLVQASTHARAGVAQAFSEVVATFGLVTVILGCSRRAPHAVAAAVGLYITAAYWFTASTSFANPAVTLARAFTDTFSGIRLNDVPAFVVAQLIGALLAAMLVPWLLFSKSRAPLVRPESTHS